jgi:hypothetical protein
MIINTDDRHVGLAFFSNLHGWSGCGRSTTGRDTAAS